MSESSEPTEPSAGDESLPSWAIFLGIGFLALLVAFNVSSINDNKLILSFFVLLPLGNVAISIGVWQFMAWLKESGE